VQKLGRLKFELQWSSLVAVAKLEHGRPNLSHWVLLPGHSSFQTSHEGQRHTIFNVGPHAPV
jgi:hypothetical protein